MELSNNCLGVFVGPFVLGDEPPPVIADKRVTMARRLFKFWNARVDSFFDQLRSCLQDFFLDSLTNCQRFTHFGRGFVWAVAVHAVGHIAIVAKDSKSFGKAVPLYPRIHSSSVSNLGNNILCSRPLAGGRAAMVPD